ncbi:MAG: 6-carboxytetrahydropterin synthase QueD [Candidatus Thermoplasmatota archaeon]
MRLCREFYFDAAHFIPNYKGKCEQPHGHTYKLEVVLEGNVQRDGMVVDFCIVKKIVESEIIEKLDHQNLNDIIDTPTAERIAEWIFSRLENKLPVYSIKLWEGSSKWVEKIR